MALGVSSGLRHVIGGGIALFALSMPAWPQPWRGPVPWSRAPCRLHHVQLHPTAALSLSTLLLGVHGLPAMLPGSLG